MSFDPNTIYIAIQLNLQGEVGFYQAPHLPSEGSNIEASFNESLSPSSYIGQLKPLVFVQAFNT